MKASNWHGRFIFSFATAVQPMQKCGKEGRFKLALLSFINAQTNKHCLGKLNLCLQCLGNENFPSNMQ